MNSRTLRLTLFACAALAQVAVPLGMIGKREAALRDGRVFKFRTAPVDPYDAFRGRYVALQLEGASSLAMPDASAYERGQQLYAVIQEDTGGFARITALKNDRPEGDAFIRTRVQHAWGTNVTLRLPFDRYYLPEGLAPRAESAYRQHSSGTNRAAYVTVRVRGGFAVLESLYIEDKPIMDYLRDNPEKK